MKRLIVLLTFVFLSKSTICQPFGKLFKQAETQRKYLLQQIAALQVYIGYAKQGYSIAKEGLNTISNIKRGDLSLHKDYFESLKTVNPEIRYYSKVGDIIKLQLNIITVYKDALKHLEHSGALNHVEIEYARGVFTRLIDDCTNTIEALIAVTTNNQFEMKDDERLDRIDALYRDMRGKYTFVQAFSNEAKLLAGARSKEKSDIKASRILNGLKN